MTKKQNDAGKVQVVVRVRPFNKRGKNNKFLF